MNDLYQDHILDHANNPRNKAAKDALFLTYPSFGEGSLKNGEAGIKQYIWGEGDNPSCGDSGIMCVCADKSQIQKVEWSGIGCAISQASMSMMSEYIIGKSLSDLKLLMPGDVYAMLGIQITPSRVNCALLSYRAVEKIIERWTINNV